MMAYPSGMMYYIRTRNESLDLKSTDIILKHPLWVSRAMWWPLKPIHFSPWIEAEWREYMGEQLTTLSLNLKLQISY